MGGSDITMIDDSGLDRAAGVEGNDGMGVLLLRLGLELTNTQIHTGI
jgi:hypothetical protein